ncbi:MAG: type IV pilin [Candidatus Verstraetearchaeota archaeon]|nr:type IV pilin [Candidatus Verstraetearchaeota archaeon]
MKNKKAISPIIATLLLIVITVAAAVVTYTFVMGFVGTGTATTGAAQGQLSYDSFSVNGTTNSSITIYLRNTGGKAVVLNAVYVDGELYNYNYSTNATVNNETNVWVWLGSGSKNWTFFTGSPGTNTTSLEVGEVGRLYIASNKPAAQSQLVKIVCADGTTLSLSVRK